MTHEETLTMLKSYLDELIDGSDAEHPAWNQEQIRQGKPNRWNYVDGLMITAILALYAHTGQKRYLDFADQFVGAFVQADGSIRTYDPLEYNLDQVNPGRNLFPLYRGTGKEKYRRAMDTLYGQLRSMPRTQSGCFWHKQIYPRQVWLDGLYMAMPFYMAYDRRCLGTVCYQDIFQQFMAAREIMRDPETGLYYHGYDEAKRMEWANPDTGLSSSFWLRSLGWLTMALCDTLEAMDEQLYYEYRMLQKMLRELAEALLPWQEEEGMFWQVPDHPGEPGNYLETSGTAMISYGFLKAARLKLLPEKFRAVGERAFWGVSDKYLRLEDDGRISLGGICLVAGLGGPEHRNGSRAYYYSEPVVKNEAKGVAPLMLAMTEMIRFA